MVVLMVACNINIIDQCNNAPPLSTCSPLNLLPSQSFSSFASHHLPRLRYCRDASESLSLVPSADDPNSRRRNVRYNRYPTQTSTEPKNGAVGAVILDIQLSYHLLELDTVERYQYSIIGINKLMKTNRS